MTIPNKKTLNNIKNNMLMTSFLIVGGIILGQFIHISI